MQGFEFLEYFNYFPFLKKHFKGVFAIDTLPKKLKYREFCICNTDSSNGTGIHWFCFLRNSKKTVECFDSLGILAEKKNILINHCKFQGVSELELNETQFQRNDSDTCGLFVIYFLFERMHNLDLNFDTLLSEIFDSEDHAVNENRVKIFCDHLKS